MTLPMRDPTTRESTYPFPRHFGPPERFEHWEPLRWLFERRHEADVPIEESVEDDHVVLRVAAPNIDPDDVHVTYTDGVLTIQLPRGQRHTGSTTIPVEHG
jgi:HSP20 family molecular chaperone IbpA